MKDIRIIIGAFAIIALFLAIIPALLEVPQMGSAWRKDAKIIPALQNISKLIPENERLVTASYDPAIFYFIDRPLEIPIRGSSYLSVLNFMEKNYFTYLLIIEGQYDVPRGFSFEIKSTNLTGDFKEIATYMTDFKNIHLYKRIT